MRVFLFFPASQSGLRFMEHSEPNASLLGSKLRPLPRGQKVADRKNRVFIFQKNTIKEPGTSNTRPKIFLAQRSGFKSN